jgi:hypothetical protein
MFMASTLSLFPEPPLSFSGESIGLQFSPLKLYYCSVENLVAHPVGMYPLGEDLLVSTDTPLLEFIQNDPLDRIVIGGTKIYGLVTRSDFLKLPVSLLGFALVTHAEALMLSLIRTTGVSEEYDGTKSQVLPHFSCSAICQHEFHMA